MLGTAADAELAFDPPLVVPALLVLNALWFFVCVVVSIRWGLTPARALSESHPEVLHRFGAVSGVDLLRGGWWRLLSACFVHIGALHLVVNLFALGMMGPLAELLWGRGRLLLIYFVSGLAGSAMAMTLKPEVAVAGASGAIWGIQMSLFAWLSANRHRLPPDLASDWFRRLCVVLALNAGVSFLPGVSWAGHLGGGAAGFAVAVLLNAARSLDRGRRIGAWVLVALLPLACVAGLAAAMGAKGIPGWHRLQQRLAAETEARLATERQKLLFDEFCARVLPRVEPLAPEAVKPLEAKAVAALVAQKRSAERVAEIRLQAERLKAIGEALLSDTAGADPSDLYTAKARAIAAARVEAFGLLLGLLGNPNRPTDEEWEAWQRARRKADLLWSHAQE
jgi:membrane associated rhomboid family serine protease